MYMKHKKIVITGGTGFVGQQLARYFGKDNHVILLSRQSAHAQNNNYSDRLVKASDGYNITYWRWDGKHVEKHWLADLDGADVVINLAGKSVNCRYNEKNKKEIIDSRVDATRTIGDAIRACTVPPKLWINASSATIYKHSMNAPNDELTGEISTRKHDNMPYSFFDRLRFRFKKFFRTLRFGRNAKQVSDLDLDFSVSVCKIWEETFFEQRTPFTRKVALRAAITLGEGGVMVPYFNLLKFGLGGKQGDGRQMYSWIHMVDYARIIEWIYEHKDIEGVYNCAAPQAVTNEEFMETLRSITGHRLGLPASAWMLEFGAAIIGTETELILKSRWVRSTKLTDAGFTFKYPTLQSALQQIIQHTPRDKYRIIKSRAKAIEKQLPVDVHQ